MANKFINNLTKSSGDIKEARAVMFSDDAQAAQEELLLKLKQEQRDLEREKLALSDLYPDSELSLMLAGPNFDAKKWTRQLQEVGIKLINKKVEVKIAEDNYNEWFKDTDKRA